MRLHVVNPSPFVGGTILYRIAGSSPKSKEWKLVGVAKCTFAIGANGCAQAPPQPLVQRDRHEGKAGRLVAASDLMPPKPRPEVLVVGSAHSLTPATLVTVRIGLGSWSKQLQIEATHPWSQRPLTEAAPPAGWGAISTRWAERARYLRPGANWSDTNLTTLIVGEHIDARFFQCAPEDQWVERIEPGIPLKLHHLHPEHDDVTVALPQLSPLMRVASKQFTSTEIPMRADTLVVDADSGTLSIVWRAQTRIGRPEQKGDVELGFRDGEGDHWPQLEAHAPSPLPSPTDVQTVRIETSSPLPSTRQRAVTLTRDHVVGTSPNRSEGPEWLTAQSAPTSSAAQPLRGQPAVLAPAPSSPSPTGPPAAPSPARAARPPSPPTPPLASGPPPLPTQGPLAQAKPQRSSTLPPTGPKPLASASIQVKPRPIAVPNPARDLIERRYGGPAVDDAPAEGSAETTTAPSTSLLLWFDEEQHDALRRAFPDTVKPPKEVDAPRKPRRGEVPAPPPQPDPKAETASARTDFLDVLQRAEVPPLLELEPRMFAALSEGERKPPLLVIEGELRFLFDETRHLDVTAKTAKAFSGTDKGLADALTVAEDAIASGAADAPRVAQAIRQRVEGAWKNANRSLPDDHVETTASRTLLAKRAFDERSLWGAVQLCAQLEGEGGAVPLYLPASIKEELPIFARLPVRVLAEVHPRQDSELDHSLALRAYAVLRILDR